MPPPRIHIRPREGGKEQYEYLPLREAIIRKGEEVNFYGAVSEYEHPKPTRGSDVICTMSVVDMSYDNPGLRLLIFASATNCPLVKSIGDIVRVHRVEMGDYKGEPQAIAKVNRKSSFILFEGKNGKGYEPYQKAHLTYSFDQQDERRLDVMRNWVESHPLCTRVSDYLVPISGVKEGSYFDLCCKILFVDDRMPELSIIMYVWDGTDAAPRTISVPPDSNGEDLSSESSDMIPPSHPLPPRDVLCDLPPLGTILPIVPELPLDDLPRQLPQPGDWVKFRNLACRTQSGRLEAVFTRESKISLLSTDTELVKNCENLYEERILSEQGHIPQACPKPPVSLTVTDFEHVPFSTLREVLAFSEVTYKFRCLVRVTSTWPTEIVDLCAPLDKDDKSDEGEGNNLQFVYGIRVTLEDPTARIHAYLYGEDGAKFFNGHPPTNLHNVSATVGALERKVHKLLGVMILPEGGLGSFRDPPWIKCCIKSYYTDKSDPWGSRCYRIFGTTFPG